MLTMRALKQRKLGGLAAFLILIWTIIGVPTKVNFNLTAATAGFTTALTTKTYLRECTNLHINHSNRTTILWKRRRHINILMEKNVSYDNNPLRETPATVFQTLVAKWSAQREDMHLYAPERPRRLLGSGVMLFQPWDVWIEHVRQNIQGRVYHARKDKSANGTTKFQIIDGAPQASHRNCHHVETQMEEAILFDQSAAGSHQTLAAGKSVTQAMNCARFGEEAHMGNNADVSTRESTQLHLPWDVWLPHAIMTPKEEDYHAGKGKTELEEKEKEPANLETLFDSGTTDVHHALVVFDAVTQDLDYVRFEEEAPTDDIADESTWE